MSGTRAARLKRTIHDSDSDGEPAHGSKAKPAGQASSRLSARRVGSRQSGSPTHAAGAATEDGDPEDHDAEQSSINASPQTRRRTVKPQQSKKAPRTTASKNASPAKTKTSPSKKPAETKSPVANASKPIYSFFNAAIQRQRSQGSTSPVKKRSPTPNIEDEDLIQDDSFDEALAHHADSDSIPVPYRKRKLEEIQASSSRFLQGSQKFLKVSNGRTALSAQGSFEDPKQNDNKPWIDKYGPNSIEELAVHKKKVSDIQEWLASALQGKSRKRLLLVKGPAGTGKTAAIKLMAQRLGAGVREWHNPETLQNMGEGSGSITSQFQDFIGSSGKYGTLELYAPSRATPKLKQETQDEQHEMQVTLVEELPNAFMHSQSGPAALRSCILQYLAAHTPSMDHLFSNPHNDSSGAPIVIIFSETLLNSSSASVDSLTAQKLLGSEITAHPGVSVIEFNPVAPTILIKALELVIRKEARDSGRRRAPGPAVLRHLAAIGDIRNAISALEFICLRGDDANAWSGRVAATSASKSRKASSNDSSTLTEIERNSLDLITQRESALGIFHAVGKVVYNKREAPAATDTPPPQPPSHLAQHHRPKIPQVDVDTLLDELGTDIQTFIAALHENYVLSCAAPDSEKTLDCINGSIDALSDADLLSSDNLGATGLTRFQFRGTSGDSLRQEELSYQTASRGLLFSLPHPVERTAPPPSLVAPTSHGYNAGQQFGGKGDAYKMFFPASFKLWRQREDIEGLLTLLLGKAQKGELRNVADLAGKQSLATNTGVESWRSGSASRFLSGPQTKPSSNATDGESATGDEGTSRLLMGGASAKGEMLLEHLPYIAIINRKGSGSAMQSDLLKQIERITRMTGLALPADDEEAEEGPLEDVSAGQRAVPLRAKKREEDLSTLTTGNAMQGLVLSDDDIEDD